MRKVSFEIISLLILMICASCQGQTNKKVDVPEINDSSISEDSSANEVLNEEVQKSENDDYYNESGQLIHVGALKTYRYWAGGDPDEGMEPINGQYWSSMHWTKEYKMYLEIKVPPDLTSYFIADNHLENADGDSNFPSDAPEWFKPPDDYEKWKGGSQGSRYFINRESGHMFMYEIQL